MIVTQVIPGQEAGNARLIVEHGAGAYGLTPAAAKAAVAAAFADDAKVWRGWKQAVENLGDAGGADRVAELARCELALR